MSTVAAVLDVQRVEVVALREAVQLRVFRVSDVVPDHFPAPNPDAINWPLSETFQAVSPWNSFAAFTV